MDLSVVGAPNQVTNLDLNAWVVMTLTDSAGGKVVHVIVDSLKMETTIPQHSAATADSAKGGDDPRVRRSHRATSRTSRRRQPVTRCSPRCRAWSTRCFPGSRPAAKAGDHWVDTTEVTNSGRGQQHQGQADH